jgi:hypothetical protein
MVVPCRAWGPSPACRANRQDDKEEDDGSDHHARDRHAGPKPNPQGGDGAADGSKDVDPPFTALREQHGRQPADEGDAERDGNLLFRGGFAGHAAVIVAENRVDWRVTAPADAAAA